MSPRIDDDIRQGSMSLPLPLETLEMVAQWQQWCCTLNILWLRADVRPEFSSSSFFRMCGRRSPTRRLLLLRYNSCHDFSPFIFLWPPEIEEEEEVAASLFFASSGRYRCYYQHTHTALTGYLWGHQFPFSLLYFISQCCAALRFALLCCMREARLD